MKTIIDEAARLMDEGQDSALATVISRNGSAPRSIGAKMLVRPDGSIEGTIGGGILEAQVQDLAREIMQERCAIIREFQFSGKDAATMDAICGGMVEVLVEWIDPTDPQMRRILLEMSAAVAQHRKSWLITCLSPDEKSTSHDLVLSDGTLIGALPAGIALEAVLESRLPEQVQPAGQRILIEPIQMDGAAYIFGAGHVSRSLAEFTRAVGFWTVVIDDRAEYASRERFPSADELIVLDSFSDFLPGLSLDRDSFVVIVTRGHLNDRAVLAQVLKTEAGYIGMIGSRRKCALVYQELRQAGFNDDDLARVHGPIGLSIDAETPEEIGVSIVAEMIQARARLRDQAV